MTRLILALTFMLWPLASAAQLFPDPDRSTINDFANVLTAEQRSEVHRQLAALRSETGIHLAVVTLTRQSAIAPEQSLEDFATGLFNHWGVGDAERDDGILFLFLTQDRRIRVELGAGFRRSWDRVAERVIDDHITPPLKENNWFEGIQAGVQQIGTQIARPFAADQPPPVKKRSPALWIFGGLLSVIGTLIGGRIFARKMRRCPQCNARGGLRRANRIITPATRVGNGQKEVTETCKHCGNSNVSFHVIPRITSSSDGSGSGGGFGGGSSSGGGASGRF